MKSLRRSLNDNKNGAGGPQSPPYQAASPLGRPSEKVAPPSKVIRAMVSHRSTNPQQLSYTKGDFWYVTGEREGWFEALRLVPKTDFEEFNKGGRPHNTSGPGLRADAPPPAASSSAPPQAPQQPIMSPPAGPSRKQSSPLYAIVQYDFQAERPDELEAKAGEPIVVIAQSNHEWFVAKPIGRLGGPGLIPVAFVEIRDPVTGKPLEISIESIPQVEEWKKATADYKAAAIPLGRFDLPPDQAVKDSPYAPGAGGGFASPAASGSTRLSGAGASMAPSAASQSQSSLARTQSSTSVGGGAAAAAGRSQSAALSAPLYRPEHDALLPPGALTALGVPSFHNESGNYWFRLHASFVPDDARAPAYRLTLYRTYEDFYEFQITLLDTFPAEAGRPQPGDAPGQSPPPRILPYMPGPVDDPIDEELTEYRREELDGYVKALLELRAQGADFILRHDLIRSFFAAKYGDYCEEVPRADVVGDLEERMADVRLDPGGGASHHAGPNGGNGQYGASAGAGPSRSQSRAAGYDPRAPSAASTRHSGRSGGVTSPQPWAGTHSRQGSSRGPSPLPPIDTQMQSRPDSGAYSRNGSAAGYYVTSPVTGATASSFGGSGAPSPYPPSSSHGHGAASAGGAAPPYIKIKIYDRATDDLIAIRVHPAVTFPDLLDKVRARLGSNVSHLRYRSGMGGYGDIAGDRDLREWLRTEDQKLVLYAEQ